MKVVLTFIFNILITISSFSQVGIGTNTPHQTSVLELNSIDKGFLPPRLTTLQRDSINNPPDGLVIFNSTKGCIEYYNSGFWYSIIGICNGPAISPITGRDSVAIGYTSQLSNVTNNGIWSSSDTSVATVSTNGLVTGKAEGTTIINYTVTINGCTNTVSKQIRCLPAVTIGQTYAGGIVVYVNPVTGYNGMLAYSTDLSRSTAVEAPWGCQGQYLGLASFDGMGQGPMNTAVIIQNCNEPFIAAQLAANLDWDLPSASELSVMRNSGLLDMQVQYWSSTEFSATQAWTVGPFNGPINKSVPLRIRPIKWF